MIKEQPGLLKVTGDDRYVAFWRMDKHLQRENWQLSLFDEHVFPNRTFRCHAHLEPLSSLSRRV